MELGCWDSFFGSWGRGTLLGAELAVRGEGMVGMRWIEGYGVENGNCEAIVELWCSRLDEKA